MSWQPGCLQSEFIAHLGEIIDLPFLLSLGFVSGKLSHRKRRGEGIQFSHEHQDHLSQRESLFISSSPGINLLFLKGKVTGKWTLKSPEGTNYICFEVPIKIVS